MNTKIWKMDELLTFPYFWKADMTVDFLHKSHKEIHNKDDEITQEFKGDLNQSVLDWNMWPCNEDWKYVIDIHEREIYISEDPVYGKDKKLEHFEILDTIYKKGKTGKRKNYKTNAFVDLHAAIRDKCEHASDLSDDSKRILGWFQEVGGKWIFKPGLFAKYWISRFPPLLPFLWVHFRSITALENFYPMAHLGIHDAFWNSGEEDKIRAFNNLPDYLQDSLVELLEQGYLNSRYIIEDGDTEHKMEFMTLADTVLETTWRGSDVIGIKISNNRMICKHCKLEINAYVVQGEYVTIHQSQKASADQITGTILLTKKLSLLKEAGLLETLDNLHDMGNRIIIITSREIQENYSEEQRLKILNPYQNMRTVKCKEIPVTWEELSAQKRKSLIQTGKLLVQGKQFLLRDIIENETLNNILRCLEGTELNNFLKTGKFTALENHKLPAVESVYMKRLIYNRAIVDSKIFLNHLKDDIFVVMQSISNKWQPTESISGYIETTSKFVFPKIILNKDNLKVIHVEDEVKDFENAYDYVEGSETNKHVKNIHFMKYCGNGGFEWQATYGSVSNVERFFTGFAIEDHLENEDQFLESLEKANKETSIIFIGDLPGMGKSQILNSFVKKIVSNSSLKKICIHFPIPFLVNKLLKDGRIQLSEVINLACCGKFEELLLNNICRTGNKVRVELFLDGLDEILNEQRNVFMQSIKNFQQEIPKARIWLTLRDCMLSDIRNQFGTLGFMLKPLSPKEQSNFLVDLWLEYLKEKEGAIDEKKIRGDLETFAKECLESCLSPESKEIAGIPLQCKIIYEIYQGQVRERDFILEKTKYSIIDLYKKLFERKDEVYFREKKKIPDEISNEDSFIIANQDQIYEVLVYLATQTLFSNDEAEKMKLHWLGKKSHKRMKNLLEVVEQHGIVRKTDPLEWVHRTYAEFCVAQYVSNLLYDYFDGNHKGLSGLDSDLYTFIVKHVLGMDYDSDGRPVSGMFKHPNLCSMLNTTLTNVSAKLSRRFGCENLELFLNHLHSMVQEYLHTIIIHEDGWEIANLVFAAAKMELKHVVFVLLQYTQNFLATVILISFRYRANSLAVYAHLNMDIASSVWDEVKDYDDTKQGILHRALFGIPNIYTETRYKSKYMFEIFQDFADLRPDLLHDIDAQGRTPFLYFACKIPYYTLEGGMHQSPCYPLESYLDYFKSKGADLLSATDFEGNTALHLAIYHTFDEHVHPQDFIKYIEHFIILIEYLNKHNVPISLNSLNKAGKTPVLLFFDIIKYIKIINLEEFIPKTWKPDSLHFGIIKNQREALDACLYKTLRRLETLGANLDLEYEDGSRLLHKVVENGYPLKLVKELLDIKVDANATNSRGQSALHMAVEKGNIDLVKLLLEHSPESLSAKDHEGKRPVDYGCTSEIHDFLNELSAKLVYGMFGCLYSMNF